MVMVGVDDSSRLADSPPSQLSFSEGRSTATWCCSKCFRWTEWNLAV